MAEKTREHVIIYWLKRIERSSLSPQRYLERYSVPFSISQFYRYRTRYWQQDKEGLTDGRQQGNHRHVHAEAEEFIRWFVSYQTQVTRKDIHEALKTRFGIEITSWGLSRCLQRLGIQLTYPEKTETVRTHLTSNAGFQLIIALAWYFHWPQATAELIKKTIDQSKKSRCFAAQGSAPDTKERNRRGRFTARYNRRADVRRARFSSIEVKRASKSLMRMGIVQASPAVIQRKCLAILALPLVTRNGAIRTINTPDGKNISSMCGFSYKQRTLDKFLSELKYLGASQELLRGQVGFWRERWGEDVSMKADRPVLCYYIDGNTKALWSKKRVKKNKVTMLGRVMGCLEQVFIHDSYGRPIYFETYSGHAPMGEYILSLFEKIAASLEGPGPRLPVNRAIVMDGASNSVGTLRAFAAQKKYHYITSLDDNQWHPRKVRQEGRPQRYRHGPATLRDCEIELEDSQEKGYLVMTRAIKIIWDVGKQTYLVTSFPRDIIDASGVVKSYFDRWPDEELSFKTMKAVACLNRVAGYGKQEIPDEKVREKQNKLAGTIRDLKLELAEILEAIEAQGLPITRLITKERRLRQQSKIINGQRILPPDKARELKTISREIAKHERRVKLLQKSNPDFKKLERAEKEWLRLQGKDKVYKADVELDQIMTYFRVSLVNHYSYLSSLLGGSPLSLVQLVLKVLVLPGKIQETTTLRHIILERTDSDHATMQRLEKAIRIINEMNIQDGSGKQFSFSIN